MIALRRGFVNDANARVLLETLLQQGYCYVQHDALGPEFMKKMKVVGRRFFRDVWPAIPPERRASIETPDGSRGVHRFVGAADVNDAIDCLSIGREVATVEEARAMREDYFAKAGWERDEYLPRLSRMNPWEDIGDRDTQHILTTGYEACHTVSMDILRHLAVALGVRPSIHEGVDVEYFSRSHRRGDGNLEVKFYPPFNAAGKIVRRMDIAPPAVSPDVLDHRPAPRVLRRLRAVTDAVAMEAVGAAEDRGASEGQVAASVGDRMAVHRDLSTITLLMQDTMGGLEVYDAQHDAFVAVPANDDAVLVNAGTFLERWTNGYIEATPHRVRCCRSDERCSVVFFCYPNFEEWIEPLALKTEDVCDESKGNLPFLAGDMMPTT